MFYLPGPSRWSRQRRCAQSPRRGRSCRRAQWQSERSCSCAGWTAAASQSAPGWGRHCNNKNISKPISNHKNSLSPLTWTTARASPPASTSGPRRRRRRCSKRRSASSPDGDGGGRGGRATRAHRAATDCAVRRLQRPRRHVRRRRQSRRLPLQGPGPPWWSADWRRRSWASDSWGGRCRRRRLWPCRWPWRRHYRHHHRGAGWTLWPSFGGRILVGMI